MDACSSVIVVIVIAREFLVSALRLVAVGEGKVIAASKWGKLKTISQMVAIIWELVFWSVYSVLGEAVMAEYHLFSIGYGIGEALLWFSTILTVISGIDYVWKNRAFINPAK